MLNAHAALHAASIDECQQFSLFDEQLIGIPHRIRNDYARTIIADARIRRNNNMARDERDDRLVFDQFKLNVAKNGAASFDVRFA